MQLLERSTATERASLLNGISRARVSPELEGCVLAYSRSADPQESFAAMLALTTFEEKSAQVIARLVELLPSADPNVYQRALWGLGQGVPEEHAHLVVDAARTFLEARSDPALKVNALHLLGQYGGLDLAPELQALADDERQADMVRAAALTAREHVLSR